MIDDSSRQIEGVMKFLFLAEVVGQNAATSHVR